MNIFKPYLMYSYSLYQNPHEHASVFSRHAHNMYELLFVDQGDISYTIENKQYRLKKNDLIFTRPQDFHSIEINSQSHYARFDIMFSSALFPKQLLKRIPKDLDVINCPERSILCDIFKKLQHYNAILDEESFCDILLALLKEIFYNLEQTKDSAPVQADKSLPLLTQILDYINENLTSINDLDEICQRFFISKSYLFKIFQTQLKVGPKKYIVLKRLLQAQKMIQKNKRPTEVYHDCGFESYSGFYKLYVNHFGHPPSEEKASVLSLPESIIL